MYSMSVGLLYFVFVHMSCPPKGVVCLQELLGVGVHKQRFKLY